MGFIFSKPASAGQPVGIPQTTKKKNLPPDCLIQPDTDYYELIGIQTITDIQANPVEFFAFTQPITFNGKTYQTTKTALSTSTPFYYVYRLKPDNDPAFANCTTTKGYNAAGAQTVTCTPSQTYPTMLYVPINLSSTISNYCNNSRYRTYNNYADYNSCVTDIINNKASAPSAVPAIASTSTSTCSYDFNAGSGSQTSTTTYTDGYPSNPASTSTTSTCDPCSTYATTSTVSVDCFKKLWKDANCNTYQDSYWSATRQAQTRSQIMAEISAKFSNNSSNQSSSEYESCYSALPGKVGTSFSIPVYSKGVFGSIDMGETYTNNLFSTALVFRRDCTDCVDAYKTMFYKRLTPIPTSLSIYNLFNNWTSANNQLNVDFKLYGSLKDLVNDTNAWTFCNYDDPGIGFPRDCGPTSSTTSGRQWNSLTKGGQGNVRFSIVKISSISDYTEYKGQDLSGGDIRCEGNLASSLTLADTAAVCNSLDGCGSFVLAGNVGSDRVASTPFARCFKIWDQNTLDPYLTNSCVGLYEPDSFDAGAKLWRDKSGKNNHAAVIGNVTVSSFSGFGSSTTVSTLAGGLSDGIIFPPSILPQTYTLITVARYAGNTKRRIFDGIGPNWLSGFWGGYFMTAWHGNGWLTDNVNVATNNWIISCDMNSSYYANGVNMTMRYNVNTQNARLSINQGNYKSTSNYPESSEWNVAFVAVFDRRLSDTERVFITNQVSNKFGLPVSQEIKRGLKSLNPVGRANIYIKDDCASSSGYTYIEGKDQSGQTLQASSENRTRKECESFCDSLAGCRGIVSYGTNTTAGSCWAVSGFPSPVDRAGSAIAFRNASFPVSLECYKKLWNQAGCTTDFYKDPGQWGWASKQSRDTVIADAATYALGLSKRTADNCYGPGEFENGTKVAPRVKVTGRVNESGKKNKGYYDIVGQGKNNDFCRYVNKPVVGRYVKVTQPSAICLNLTEVEVYDDLGNYLHATSSMSSQWGTRDIIQSTDRSIFTLAHTQCEANGWIQLDLGSDRNIGKIVINNRRDCCTDRAIGVITTITNNSNTIVWTSPAITEQRPTYVYFPTPSNNVPVLACHLSRDTPLASSVLTSGNWTYTTLVPDGVGVDSGGLDLGYYSNKTAQQARDMCDADARCAGFSFRHDTNEVWLKTGVQPPNNWSYNSVWTFYKKTPAVQQYAQEMATSFNGKTVENIIGTSQPLGYISGRYVKLMRKNECLHINELEIYGPDGTKYSYTPSMSSVYNNANQTFLNDNNFYTTAHTNCSGDQWIQADLGSDKQIERIVIYNRTQPSDDACRRIIGANLQVRNNANTLVWTRSIFTLKDVYDFNLISDPEAVGNETKWEYVKRRKDQNNSFYSGLIYDAMAGDPPGTRKPPFEGGVGFNEGNINGKFVLDKASADALCQNPCYWYYNEANAPQYSKDKINLAGLCDCSTSTAKNF